MDADALYDAVWNNGDVTEVFRILDGNDSLLNAVIDTDWGAGVLHCATEKGLSQIVEMLLQRKDIDINMRNKNGCTPLYYACSFAHMHLVKLLLEHKARTDLSRTVQFSSVVLYCIVMHIFSVCNFET